MNPEFDDIEPVSPTSQDNKDSQFRLMDNLLSSEKKWSKADLIKTSFIKAIGD